MLLKLNRYVARLGVLLIMVALLIGMMGCGRTPSEGFEIRTWYGLDAVRDNLGGSYILMNDLDSTTAGYEELAGPTASGGEGWIPIGTEDDWFTGTLDGQGYEIGDLYISRPEERGVGLFGYVDEGGYIEAIGVVNANVTGRANVGVLAGYNEGHVYNSYSAGSVVGVDVVGGLVGTNGYDGTVSKSYSTGSVTGNVSVGGLVGGNFYATVSNTYFTGIVTGEHWVGGLIGVSEESTVSNSYCRGNVTGDAYVGGLVGPKFGTVNNCYAEGNVTGTHYVGGLIAANMGTVSNSYSTGSVTGDEDVGGLLGRNWEGAVSNSFWNIETSGQATSDGGTGKNTTEMQDFTTFSGAMWSILAVANPSSRNPSYTWNIVDGETYPFLSWEP